MALSDRDKTPKLSGWGHDFHLTNPQRRVPCVLGDMLAPRSADDIPPITPAAMASVQAALKLLADLVEDREHGIFLAVSDAKLEECRVKARDIRLAARGLAGILRVEEPVVEKAPVVENAETAAVDAKAEIERLVAEMEVLPPYQGWMFTYEYPGFFRYSHPELSYSVFFTPDYNDNASLPIEVQTDDGDYVEEHSTELPLSREGRTGEKLLGLVRPTLDKLGALAGVRRSAEVLP